MNHEVSVENIVQRAEERFQTHRDQIYQSTDRIFVYLMIGQWFFAILIALVFSPYGWSGKTKVIHEHVYVALLLGGLITSLPLYLAIKRPGWVLTRHVMAASQMLWSALLIHLSGGRIETHFHIFGSLAFLSFYRDWKVLVTATVVVATDHLLRGMLWPESVYGITNPEWWRFLEHAFWVFFEIGFLIFASVRSVGEMKALAENGAYMEALAEKS